MQDTKVDYIKTIIKNLFESPASSIDHRILQLHAIGEYVEDCLVSLEEQAEAEEADE